MLKYYLIALAAIAILVSIFKNSKSGFYFTKDGSLAFEVTTPAGHPYLVRDGKIDKIKNGYWLTLTTNLPEGTFYSINLNREMITPNSSMTMSPDAGFFVPEETWKALDSKKLYDDSFIQEFQLLGKVKDGKIRGQIMFHPIEVQLFGCTLPCRPDPYIKVHVRIPRKVEAKSEDKRRAFQVTLEGKPEFVFYKLDEKILFNSL